MTTTYVAIDVETTGLDPARDAIIEVAALTLSLIHICRSSTTRICGREEVGQ